MTRNLLTTISLTIAFGCIASSGVHASNYIAKHDSINTGGPSLMIAGVNWAAGEFGWLPLAIHEFICGG